MFDFRECWGRHGGADPSLFSLRAFPTFRSHDIRHGCLYVESSEGGRGGLKRFVIVVA